jgi:hypothetical protein
MTPLAMELAEDIYSKLYLRPADAIDGSKDEKHLRSVLWSCLHQCKFFDCSEVAQIAYPLASKTYDAFEKYDRVDQRLAFLPAEWTWIEVENPGFRDDTDPININVNEVMHGAQRPWTYTYRTAFVFIARKGVTHMVTERLSIGYETPHQPGTPRVWRLHSLPPLPLVHSGLKPHRTTTHRNASGDIREFDKPTAAVMDFTHYAFLALINSPRIIGQRLHYPHERIEREKLKKLKLVGKFPLRAWTEIILKVAMPEDQSGEPSKESHLTGERCLHFCRTYLRVRYGMIEYIEGHWRGNPALGMAQSRYKVKIK